MEPAEYSKPCLHLVGASVRAAAQSLRRAGWSAVAWDLFADADLQALCPAFSWDWNRYDQSHPWDRFPPGPWMYTGCLENAPELVDQLAQQRELLGNTGEVLRKVRDPFLVHDFLSTSGFSVPPVRGDTAVPSQGIWMFKPRRSGGGFRLRSWKLPEERGAWENWRTQAGCQNDDFYWQAFVAGTPCSAVYIGHPDRTWLVGATEQLIGTPPAGDSRFRYMGSVGPLRLTRLAEPLQRLGLELTRQFQLRGIFGVDFIRRGAQIVPIEINPRYPASCELLERATGDSLLAWHIAACREQPLLEKFPREVFGESGSANRYFGKAILFARRPLTVSSSWSHRLVRQNIADCWPAFADIPAAGEIINTGQPILTVFRQGRRLRELRRILKHRTRSMNIPG